MRTINPLGRLLVLVLFVVVMLGSVGQVQAKVDDVAQNATLVMNSYLIITDIPLVQYHYEDDVIRMVKTLRFTPNGWSITIKIYWRGEYVAIVFNGRATIYKQGAWVNHLRKVAKTLQP